MMRRIAVMVATIVGLLAAPVAAMAAPTPYPPPPPSLTANSTTVQVGGSVVLQGEGCAAGATVRITAAGKDLATATADNGGTFSATVGLTVPGKTVVGASCGDVSMSVEITVLGEAAVVAPGGNAGGALPNTGVNQTLMTLGIGGASLAIILGGGLLWLGATRRARRHSA